MILNTKSFNVSVRNKNSPARVLVLSGWVPWDEAKKELDKWEALAALGNGCSPLLLEKHHDRIHILEGSGQI